MSLLTDASSLLGPEGPFSRLLENYRVRDSQQQMSARIEQAMAEKEILIAESGTGTGKTLAYLVPALLSGKKVLVSTGTRHLQDQLYKQDLPLVRQALEVPATMALLKGRSNYLCKFRLEQAEQDQSGYRPYPNVDLAMISKWSLITLHGDVSEVSGVPEQSRVWSDVTSTVDNCIGNKCGYYDDCYVNTARKDAMEADIVVVNHHLFLADVALKAEGYGQLLPNVEVVIFDEAHQIPDTASMYFSTGISQRQILDLSRDARLAEITEKSGITGFEVCFDTLETLAKECRLAMGRKPTKGSWSDLEADEDFVTALAALKQGLQDATTLLEAAAAAGDQLDNCFERVQVIVNRLNVIGSSNDDLICWFETSKTGFRLYSTPLSIAGQFREGICEQDRCVIFTSATLAVSGSFSHYQQLLGLDDASTGIWPGPFNYPEQSLFYLPEGLPDPGDRQHTASVVELAEKLIKRSEGGVFMLFTSYRALNDAADMLKGRLDFPLLVQGEAPRHELLERFRHAGNAVLLATGSFWEGVDVKGDALAVVIIDKFPFAAPDDPVLQARSKAVRNSGLNPFMTLQLPQAVVALRQGAGRLIRTVEDKGVFVLCDNRLVSKSYGKIFTRSLPAMKRTRDFAEVSTFLERNSE